MRQLRSLALAASLLGVLPAAATAQMSDGVVRIGILNDMNGPYADLAGPGSVLAAQMAAEEFGNRVAGVPVEIVSANHQNKPDVGAEITRRWVDQDKVDAIADVPTSSVALAVQNIVRDKQKVFLISGAAAASLSGKDCSPFSIQTSDDTNALSIGTTRAVVKSGADSWFFLTADYVFGHAMEAESTKVIKAHGGTVLGGVRHPQNTADFASYLLRAKGSGAKAIGLANAGNDTITSIKQAVEFGLTQSGQRLVGLILFISDIHALGLQNAHGLMLTEGFYWDMDPVAREWSQRFHKRFGKMPTRQQATTYATVVHYLRAIDHAKTDDSRTVVARMKAAPMKYFGHEGRIREDGRFVHDLKLYEVKHPSESKYPWDYYKTVTTIPGEEAFASMADGGCPLVAKR
ncbi:ABC transporter substrate-binding protein [Quisquiliibacterium transsilvanicum]|uniref:Branched-chain amino acid transport system substrate-binding protein n=1 Tax=Quisquiliibacterium transsilvanicum TaxID=1549638 RepID=A0A7W8HGK1_9BURK|nr:ABC transporter substrate-binding protein [Quisquiliibacterium transsilvanicum]MBB5271699.1 branched-chain amino acid transport system substrate-binding protein [Quisquiliibacterium transsilvanicum]